MGNVLFEHNRQAYEAALAMLKERGRAAVIHPTGTGKSFIAFQLCADHPDKAVCWLSPSEHIFRVQLENWGRACRASGAAEDTIGLEETEDTPEPEGTGKCPASLPGNIHFFTYAKLMSMSGEELSGLAPDYIILDEFHRCGAAAWGQGVQRLLGLFPDVPVLGLSATNIRYLDGQRDMADELFDGNIASQMTLGGAIVRGILQPPKYILAAYSCREGLERYRARVQGARNQAVRREADRYLEALKRALEQADGLDEVFCRHMEPGGRYLVFCADYAHMREMEAKAAEWFRKVDPEPHLYSVYSEDPGTEEEFRRFREDTSEHLKLLYCIDMLNEGIHVEDVSGVVLLRPTVSPIIYKQQIGRALAAGKKKGAAIFDIVMNIENLYSIGTMEEEMREAAAYYRSHGLGDLVVNEHFHITGGLQDCLRLFRRLEDTLGASWELMYAEAEQYYQSHGNLEAPKRYKTPEGLSLGQWLDTQRKVRAGKVPGILTETHIRRLDAIGMRWQGKRGVSWERNFAAAQKYYAEHGHLLAKADEEYDGVKLGKWLAQLREQRKRMQCMEMQECDAEAEAAGRSQGDGQSVQCMEMQERGADAGTAGRSQEDGQQMQRTGKNAPTKSSLLTPERIKELDGIGMVWDVQGYRWERNFSAAKQYYREHGNLDVPYYYVDGNGIRLGAWLCGVRAARVGKDSRRAALSREQVHELEDIGMCWEGRWDSAWERSYEAARRYRELNGNLDIPFSYVAENGCRLGRWIRHQRDALGSGLDGERKRRLEAIGMAWDSTGVGEK